MFAPEFARCAVAGEASIKLFTSLPNARSERRTEQSLLWPFAIADETAFM